MAVEGALEQDGRAPGRWKAFGVMLVINMLCLPLVFVLIFFWPIFILAIAPYIAGALGGRYTDRRTGFWMGGVAALVMVTVLVIILLSTLAGISGLGEGFDLFEPIGLGIVVSAYFTAFIFGALGGRHGAIAEEEED
jgi:hypothetical protein